MALVPSVNFLWPVPIRMSTLQFHYFSFSAAQGCRVQLASDHPGRIEQTASPFPKGFEWAPQNARHVEQGEQERRMTLSFG